MSLSEMRRGLSSISIVVFPVPGDEAGLAERIRRAVEGAGLKAFIRAEGYAFMPSEVVGILGLPHLRLAVVEGRIVMWVRDPHRLGEGCLEAGLRPEELYESITRAARAAASEVMAYCSETGAEAMVRMP